MAKGRGGFIGQDGLNAPDSPTAVSASAGDTQATVSFTAPTDVGGSAITGYNVQSNDGSGTIFPSYDVENASYDSVSFSVASQEANPMGLFFKPDGTKMFVTGLSGDDVNEYALSTAWDISSASFTATTSVSSQSSGPTGLYFKSDGTVAFICCEDNNAVYQYNLSSAWDISTLSYASKSFSIASQETSAGDLYFKDDGTKMYVIGSSSDKVHQYSLSSAYDVSTASYDNAFLDVSSYTTQPEGLFFSSDGTKVIVGGHDGGVDLYTLSSAWSISTGSYSETFDSTSQTTEVKGLAFKDDGVKMYLIGTNSDTIYQYSSGTAVGNYPTASPVTVTGLSNGTSYTFNVWAINAFGYSAPSDASGSVTPVGHRGLFFGGTNQAGSALDVIDYITITTTGNATDFGDLDTVRTDFRGAFASSTRGVVGGGNTSPINKIQYVTIASTGNATDFGDLLSNTTDGSGASNESRGIFFGGNDGGAINVIEYVTIATEGNSIDFGDLTLARVSSGSAGSTTRIVTGGGRGGNPYPRYNNIDYVTIASTGNSTDFGDLTNSRSDLGAVSSSTRTVFASGYDGTNVLNTMDYVTTASTGSATDFGDLTSNMQRLAGASNKTRGVFGGGYSAGALDIIQYITIASTGNATDFGDLTVSRYDVAGCSNVHGGIS